MSGDTALTLTTTLILQEAKPLYMQVRYKSVQALPVCSVALTLLALFTPGLRECVPLAIRAGNLSRLVLPNNVSGPL